MGGDLTSTISTSSRHIASGGTCNTLSRKDLKAFGEGGKQTAQAFPQRARPSGELLLYPQGESAGAQAFSNFDALLAPFIRYDDLTYTE